jgi:hypothetical protein
MLSRRGPQQLPNGHVERTGGAELRACAQPAAPHTHGGKVRSGPVRATSAASGRSGLALEQRVPRHSSPHASASAEPGSRLSLDLGACARLPQPRPRACARLNNKNSTTKQCPMSGKTSSGRKLRPRHTAHALAEQNTKKRTMTASAAQTLRVVCWTTGHSCQS